LAVGAGADGRIRMHARMRVFVRCGAARSVTELLWELSTVWGETQRCAAVTPRGRVRGRGQHGLWDVITPDRGGFPGVVLSSAEFFAEPYIKLTHIV
jgi:hypothetical protein